MSGRTSASSPWRPSTRTGAPGASSARSTPAAAPRPRGPARAPQLDALFRDLPEPHPAYPSGAPAAPAPPPTGPPAAPDLPELVAPTGAAVARHAGMISMLTPVAAALLFAVSGGRFPWVFLLVPIVIAAVAFVSHRHQQ